MSTSSIIKTVNRPADSWQRQLSGARRSFSDLCTLLNLPASSFDAISELDKQFPLIVPEPYLSRIIKGDQRDPLLLQVLPQAEELVSTPGFSVDPLEEADASPVAGLIHKYHGRVLLVASSTCAIHCRYCFRRHFPYQENRLQRNQHQQALDYIKSKPDIHEVILSGGDPLTLSNAYLQWLVNAIKELPQITTLRIHTRLPIVIPNRVDAELLEILRPCTPRTVNSDHLNVVMVVHCNHPNEIDDDVEHALLQLKDAGITLLNQSVLLKEINDQADTLTTLSHRIFKAGVLPYYLHVLDAVQGAAHFDVPESVGLHIIAEMTQKLPGYLVPRLVRENPGATSKTTVTLITD